MCEDCKQMRHMKTMRECYPEREREMRHIMGQDSEPDPVLSQIPEGMSEREARVRGYI